MPRQQADPGRMRRVPAEREHVAAEHGAHREGDRKVQHDREPGGKGGIVNAGAVPDRDRHVADHPARVRDDDVADDAPDVGVVGDRVVLAGLRIAMRVPGEGAAERAVERVVALLLQGLGQLDGEAPGLDQGEGAAADPDHVGVHGVVATAARPGRRRSAECRRRGARPDPAVAIPRRPAILEGEAVHHAIAEEPVLTGEIGIDRVGAHLQVAAVEAGRDRTGHDQVVQRQLGAHRRVDAELERRGGAGQALAVVGRDPLDAGLDRRADGGLDGVRH